MAHARAFAADTLAFAVEVFAQIIHHNLFITLSLGFKLISVLSIQTVLYRVKCISRIRKGVLNSHLGSNTNPCYNQKTCYNEPR